MLKEQLFDNILSQIFEIFTWRAICENYLLQGARKNGKSRTRMGNLALLGTLLSTPRGQHIYLLLDASWCNELQPPG